MHRVCIALALCVLATRVHADPAPHEFLPEAKALLVVGACADGDVPAGIDPATVTAHCKKLRAAQEAYRTSWLALATPFFAEHVPSDIPKIVVYPFAGGDLSTALTVYPDADEITTLSLEPAGDPRALAKLDHAQLRTSLATVAVELSSLYRANFSVTLEMIDAMRGGALPTQLIFGLSALWLHGYEPVSLRYFRLTKDGELHYLTDDDLTHIDAIHDLRKRNRELANIELHFRKVGSTHEQVYRHIMANLDDDHLRASPGPLRYLESKGQVAAMTKAASYLLAFDGFQTMRQYLIDHVRWMVSDATGLPPTYGTPAGFTYETYGTFAGPNQKSGMGIAPVWKKLFASQPHRDLAFRFGYPDSKLHGLLVIMRRPTAP